MKVKWVYPRKNNISFELFPVVQFGYFNGAWDVEVAWLFWGILICYDKYNVYD